MQVIAIIGASGFIGKHLIVSLLPNSIYRVKVLSRDKQKDIIESRFPPEVEIVEGSLHNLAVLEELLEPACTVINLAYLWDAGEVSNLKVTNNLLVACRNKCVRRLIHVSTAAVVGRVSDNPVTEKTFCNPVTQYGITKLKIEQAVRSGARNHFDSVILRPTSVFGVDGNPLKKLANDLLTGSPWINYAKSCLFGRRRMNLVHIDNVVAAIIFLTCYPSQIECETFIVSDDDDPKNNFAYVERFLKDALGIEGYSLPRLTLPLWVLSFLLAIRGRNNINPHCNYDTSKLLELGYERPMPLDDGLTDYAVWYRSINLVQDKPVNL